MLKELIKKRRSIRVFTGKRIPEEDIKKIIEAGIWAPSGCNNQELRFLILEDMEEIKKFKPHLQGVSHFILIFADMSLPGSKMYKNKHERNLPYVDTGLALQNMVLYAKSIGIDSCICNLSEYHFIITGSITNKILNKIRMFFKMRKNSFEYVLRNKLKVPKQFEIMCSVALGYGKIKPDINTVMHEGMKIMRKNVGEHIL